MLTPPQTESPRLNAMLTLRPFRACPRLFRPLHLRKWALRVPAILALAALAGCNRGLVPPCPPVRVDSATATLTKFKDGPSRDLAEVEYQAEILGYKGQCVYSKDSVRVTFDVDFAITGGPGAKGGSTPLYYFVAVPQFFPQLPGKRIMQVIHKLPAKAGAREVFTESSVSVRIPLKKDEAGASYDVYVGFQPDNEQLEYNRSRTP